MAPLSWEGGGAAACLGAYASAAPGCTSRCGESWHPTPSSTVPYYGASNQSQASALQNADGLRWHLPPRTNSPSARPPPPLPQALEKCQLLEVMALSAVDLVRKAALSPALAGFRPSVVAAACLLSAREQLGLAPAWPRTLQSMTAYTPAAEGALKQCLEVMQLLGIGRTA